MKRDPQGDHLPDEELRRLELDWLHEYVQATGWRPLDGLGRGLVAVYDRPENRLKQVQVPLRRELDDLDFVLSQAVNLLAEWEHRRPQDIVLDVRFFTTDVLAFGETSPAADGGLLPFSRARELFTGIRRTLLSAAHAVLDPQPVYLRLDRGEAEQFLARCQFGQTRPGSFTMTLHCPLDALPGRDSLLEQEPFTRKVISHLMSVLHTLVVAERSGNADSVLHSATNEFGLSANLCEGLLDLAPEGDTSSLEIVAHWARRLPLPELAERSRSVRLTRRTFDFIEGVASRLRSVGAPDTRQVFFGSVETLDGRVNADNRREGPVFLRVVDEEAEARRVRVELKAEDYQRAVEAHTANRLVSFRGLLRRGGRVSRVEEPSDFQIVPTR